MPPTGYGGANGGTNGVVVAVAGKDRVMVGVKVIVAVNVMVGVAVIVVGAVVTEVVKVIVGVAVTVGV